MVHQGVLEPNAVILRIKVVGLMMLAFPEFSHYHHCELSSKMIVFLNSIVFLKPFPQF